MEKSLPANLEIYLSSSKQETIDTVTLIIRTLSTMDNSTAVVLFLFLFRFSHAMENGVTRFAFLCFDSFSTGQSLNFTASTGDIFRMILQGFAQLINLACICQHINIIGDQGHYKIR